MSEPDITELKRQAAALLKSVKDSLEGLLIEIKGAQRRSFEMSDFTIHEFRQLASALEHLTAQLERHK